MNKLINCREKVTERGVCWWWWWWWCVVTTWFGRQRWVRVEEWKLFFGSLGIHPRNIPNPKVCKFPSWNGGMEQPKRKEESVRNEFIIETSLRKQTTFGPYVIGGCSWHVLYGGLPAIPILSFIRRRKSVPIRPIPRGELTVGVFIESSWTGGEASRNMK